MPTRFVYQHPFCPGHVEHSVKSGMTVAWAIDERLARGRKLPITESTLGPLAPAAVAESCGDGKQMVIPVGAILATIRTNPEFLATDLHLYDLADL
jgi:hypothetical protein